MSGLFFEKHYFEALLDFCFQCILGWKCLDSHPTLQVVLGVYVDEFEVANEKESLAKAWQLIRDKGVKLDPLEPFAEYLGCGQHTIALTPQAVQRRLEHMHPIRGDPDRPGAAQDIAKRAVGKPIRAIAYDMHCVFQQVVER